MARASNFRMRGLGFCSVVTVFGFALALLAPFTHAVEEEKPDASPGTIRFVGKNAIATANGTFHDWRFNKFEVDLERIESSEVTVEIDIASVDTDSKRRDAHLRTADFFEVETWPTATVRIHGAQQVGDAKGGETGYRASFEIRIRDVTKTIEGNFVISDGSPRTVKGQLELDRIDFGVGSPHSRWNPMSIRNVIPIEFVAVLERS